MSVRKGTDVIAGTPNDLLNSKANTSLSNLDTTGKNIANWSSNVTNCITEIPQDIKLELNNGTLTLKAGSKVYVPNGAGVFDVVTIANDLTINSWAYNGSGLLVVKPSNSTFWQATPNENSSGSTTPTSTQHHLWYDTTNNKVKTTTDYGSSWTDGYSLPIAVVSSNGSSYTSIDQIFDGFGYIGNSVFTLPGVKGLIPSGKNTDGTYITTAKTISSVITRTFTSSYVYDYSLAILENNSIDREVYYKLNDNGYLQGSDGNIYSGFEICRIKYTNTSGKILNMQQFHSMRFVDYNEFSEHKVISFMLPSAGNNYSWYRLYNDGWVEQGGQISKPDSTAVSVVLPVAMSDSNYSIQVTDAFSGNMATAPSVGAKTTTGFNIYQGNGGRSVVCLWEVKGSVE